MIQAHTPTRLAMRSLKSSGYHYTPTRMVKIQDTDNNKYW